MNPLATDYSGLNAAIANFAEAIAQKRQQRQKEAAILKLQELMGAQPEFAPLNKTPGAPTASEMLQRVLTSGTPIEQAQMAQFQPGGLPGEYAQDAAKSMQGIPSIGAPQTPNPENITGRIQGEMTGTRPGMSMFDAFQSAYKDNPKSSTIDAFKELMGIEAMKTGMEQKSADIAKTREEIANKNAHTNYLNKIKPMLGNRQGRIDENGNYVPNTQEWGDTFTDENGNILQTNLGTNETKVRSRGSSGRPGKPKTYKGSDGKTYIVNDDGSSTLAGQDTTVEDKNAEFAKTPEGRKLLGLPPLAPTSSGQPLSEEQAKDFLKAASGDKNEARKMAAKAGYSF